MKSVHFWQSHSVTLKQFVNMQPKQKPLVMPNFKKVLFDNFYSKNRTWIKIGKYSVVYFQNP